jgi:putrescine transport system ATP-binding protein
LVNIQEELGTTFVVVTHDQEEAMSIASQIGVMDAGKLVQVGTPQELYDTPRTKFLADFLGQVSFLPATVTKADKKMVSAQGACLIQAAYADEGAAEFAVGDDVTIALRPEKINLTRGVAKGPNQLDVVIEELGYLGSVTHVRARTEEGIMLKILLSNRRRDEADFTWEDHALASFDAKDAIILSR